MAPPSGDQALPQLRDRVAELEHALADHQYRCARQRLDALGVMAGGVAHDFNNLLTGIIGSVDLAMLERPVQGHAPLREHLAYIQEVTEQARRLCLQLLAYSGAAPFEIAPGDLSAVLGAMRPQMARSARGLPLVVELSEGIPEVALNAPQLQQAVLSLVRNAADALDERHGTITVRTECCVLGDGEVLPPSYQPLTPGHYAVIEVRDTGCGMDQDTLTHILDPFFSTKLIGRGLGMAIVLGAVRAHGGAVEVRSRIGEGTTVRLLLPVLSEAAVAEPAPVVEDGAWLGSGVVLVVDDEPLSADICARMLKRLGFTAVTATSGAEAIEVFEAEAGDVACAVVDVTMPGMSGMELLHRLRELRPGLPGVLMTGYSAGDATAGASQAQGTVLLQKPYELKTLRRLLREVLA